MVIWANHNLRAAISAMREVSRRIYRDQALTGVENAIAGVQDVFELAGNDELAAAEKRYLPTPRDKVTAIVLAASRGAALGPLTADKPKCMIDVRGQPILRRLVGAYKDSGVHEVVVVRGYMKDKINLPSIATVDNDLYASTGEAASLACAASRIAGDCFVSYGDILFRQHYLDQLMHSGGDIAIAVDALWTDRRSAAAGWVRDLVRCSQPFSGDYLDDQPVSAVEIGNNLEPAAAHGEWIGVAKLSAEGSRAVRAEIDVMRADGTLPKASMLNLLQRLIDRGRQVRVIYVLGQWLDVDDAADVTQAGKFL
jgi:phosphoenolpyruvate phosphomutase